jgi:CheY-like chemotaxis protein
MKVLVVDDSRVMRQLVIRALRQAGHGHHDWLEAESATQAFDLVEADEPDLVLCDWNMPGMSGLELLARLRRVGCTVPLGLVTSEGSDAMRRRAVSAGAAFLIAKPFTPDDFRGALDAIERGLPVAASVAPAEPGAPLPPPHRVKELLEGLLSRKVQLRPGDPVLPTSSARAVVGSYVDDQLRLVAVVVADVALAAHAGAALGLLPAAAANEGIASGTLTAAIALNAAEVLNVSARLLNTPGQRHVRLYEIHSPTDALPGDVSALLRSFGARLDVVVDIAGYGGGGLSLVRA